MITNFHSVSFAKALEHHFSSSTFANQKADGTRTWKQCVWGIANGAEVTMGDTRGNTCAVRLSLALHRAGAKFLTMKKSWYFDDPKTKSRKEKTLLPTSAGDYNEHLPSGVTLKTGDLKPIQGLQGILFFKMGTNHVTLWNKAACHFEGTDDRYANSCEFMTFWNMSP